MNSRSFARSAGLLDALRFPALCNQLIDLVGLRGDPRFRVLGGRGAGGDPQQAGRERGGEWQADHPMVSHGLEPRKRAEGVTFGRAVKCIV